MSVSEKDRFSSNANGLQQRTEWGPYADPRIQDIIHVMASAYHQRFGAHEGGAPYAAEKIGAENSLTSLLDWLELENPQLAYTLRWGPE